MKTGIIDVGGGFRDIYGAGVLDVCIERGIHFDYCIGVSAGSANLASFLAGQKGRNYRFYTEFAFRKAYASMDNWIATKSYVDLDYAYSVLSNHDGEYPLDYPTLRDDPAEFLVVATHAQTGKPVYFHKDQIAQDDYDVFKASSALPLSNQPYTARGITCFDGGLSDPIPLQRAFDDGCDRVVLILTRPVAQQRTQKKDRLPARLLAHSHPEIAQCLLSRYKVYNDGVAFALACQAEGRVCVVAPDDILGMSTLTRSREKLDALYQKGRNDAAAIEAFLAREA